MMNEENCPWDHHPSSILSKRVNIDTRLDTFERDRVVSIADYIERAVAGCHDCSRTTASAERNAADVWMLSKLSPDFWNSKVREVDSVVSEMDASLGVRTCDTDITVSIVRKYGRRAAPTTTDTGMGDEELGEP